MRRRAAPSSKRWRWLACASTLAMSCTRLPISHVWLLADIYEYELPFIKVGQTATVTLSYDPKTVLQGRIAFVYPTLDTQTRTAKVRFELANPREQLKPGMYANVA